MISETGNSTSYNFQIPNQASNEAKQKSPSEDFEKKAQSMGVPEDIIKQGKQAVKAWVMESKQGVNANDKVTDNRQIIPQEENSKGSPHISLFA